MKKQLNIKKLILLNLPYIPSFFPLTRTRQIRICGMYWPMD
jgi:hypothetical protein